VCVSSNGATNLLAQLFDLEPGRLVKNVDSICKTKDLGVTVGRTVCRVPT